MSLLPGDPWPKVVVADAANAGVDLSHQTRAGRTTLIALCDVETAQATAEHLDRLAEGGPAALATYVLAPMRPGPALTGAGRAEIFRCGEGAIETLGGTAGRLLLIDRRGRVRGTGTLAEAARLLALAGELEGEAGAAAAFAPVLLIPGLLEPDLCERIIRYWEGEPKLVNAVAARVAGNASINPEFKRRADVVLQHPELLKAVSQRIERRLLPEVRKYLRARLIESEAFRIGCYDSADLGGFKRHRDNTTPHTLHRSFAMSLNLNDPESYEGGSVIFPEFGERLYRPPLGGAVVFCCGLLHEALPVTRGRRFGMFTFFADEEGMKVIAERRARAAAEGQRA